MNEELEKVYDNWAQRREATRRGETDERLGQALMNSIWQENRWAYTEINQICYNAGRSCYYDDDNIVYVLKTLSEILGTNKGKQIK